MTKNKNERELMREARRAFAKAYAEDMDNWSALRQEQENRFGSETRAETESEAVNTQKSEQARQHS